MTRSREIFQMNVKQSEKTDGFYVSKKFVFLFVLASLLGCIFVAWLSHYFTAKTLLGDGDLKVESESDVSDAFPKIAEEDTSHRKERKNRLFDDAEGNKSKSVRLPKSVVPTRYEIRLVPFIFENNFTFNGEVKIIVEVAESTDTVILHAFDLEIETDEVRVVEEVEGKQQPEPVQVRSLRNETEKQIFVVELAESLYAGRRYQIEMKFKGRLNDHLQGFYRSSYNVGKTKRWIATTQFQATDARRAFPCFDEPAFKSKFKLFIGRPVNMTSISNMPQSNTGTPIVGLPDYVWDEYEESVPMSTYLVAFVVSDFSSLSNGDKFRVWARESAINQAKYGLEIGPKILSYFEKYFGIGFPLPKMDMIALPDFAAGAMENWGLITFRETAMLYEEGVSSSSSKQRVATVISHELAHQWFGNLVTPSWWSDLWLNEGFASYVEYLGVEAVEPSWKIMEQFVINEVQNVFALDALKTSHQISVKVHHPDEISEIFDRISYGKGASLIRMMDHFLTTAVFKRGLSKYLKSHEFSNAEQDDLWTALTEQAHEDGVMSKNTSVKTIMDTWTLQTGFPVVTVNRDYFRKTAVVRQERFLLFKTSPNEKDEKVLWWVPLTYTNSKLLNFNSTYPSQWLKQEEEIFIDNFSPEDAWVLFNIKQTGFYRVNYDERNWNLLIDYLMDPSLFKNVCAINRAQLVDDALNLARAELLNYDIAMNLTRYLSNEVDYLPWKSAFTAFSYMNDMMIKTAGYDKFKAYILKIVDKLYNEVGFATSSKDPQLTIYKRINVLTWACSLGHPDCVKNSVLLYQKWKEAKEPDNNNPISPDLKSVVYCTALKFGNEEDWDFAWERFKKTNVASERDILLDSLGCTRDVSILSKILDLALTEGGGTRKQDAARLFNSISKNPSGQILALNMLTDQWYRIKNYFKGFLFSVGRIVKSATKTISTKSQLKQLTDFASEHKNEFGGATRTMDQALEQANANVKWMERNYEKLIKWLTQAVD